MRQAVEDELKPSRRLMQLIGEEIIHGYRGRSRLTYITIGPRGGITASRSALYPAGIWRGTSPNGNDYDALSPVTISLKKRAGSQYPNTPLIDSRELVNGLYFRVLAGNRGVEVNFKSDELARKSLRLERGGQFQSPVLAVNSHNAESGKRLITVPARPHREMQPAVRDVIARLMTKWAEHKKVI